MDISAYNKIVPHVFLFVDRRCFPDWEIIRQQIDFHDLTFIVEGKADYYVNGEKITVEAGDVIYIPEGSVREAHTYKDHPMHSYAFNFKLDPSNSVHLPFPTVSKHHITSEVLQYIREFTQVWMIKQPGYEIYARGLFHLIIHRMLAITVRHSTDSQADTRINKVREYIVDHYSEELNLETIAQVANLHPVYLSKLFKKDTGYSFKQFLNLIRVNNAEMILSAGGFTVSEVAERCGFKDISYFSNVFKAMKGYPPSLAGK